MISSTGENFKKKKEEKRKNNEISVTLPRYFVWFDMESPPLKTLILQMQTTTEKIKLTAYLILAEIKFLNLKNENILRKRAQKVKKHNSFTLPDYLPQYHS